tara:strand:- start:1790 stop:2194 length:405 start_codon:yes stop_codon:yes gene_type:complete
MRRTFLFILLSLFYSINILAHHPNHQVEAEKPYPSINLNLTKDNMDGYNLYIELNNFKLSPSLVGKDNQPNTGHLHLYVNDIKIARIYSNWFHIPERYFNLNENLIKVTLNSNMHGVYTINGKPIQANLKISKN